MENDQEHGVEFFIDELARMEHEEQRHYDSLSKRVAELEKSSSGKSSEIFDSRMIGLMVFLTIAPIILQITADLIAKWRSSE